MPNHRLTAVVTAFLLVFAAIGARAEATLEQLQEIDRLLSARDNRALWHFLQDNPGLMAGDDELAVELRNFCLSVTGGKLSCYSAPVATRNRSNDRPAAVAAIY